MMMRVFYSVFCTFFVLYQLMIGASAVYAARQVPASEADLHLSFSPVVKQAAPAVVNIYTKRKVVDRSLSPFAGDPFFQQFFGRDFGLFGMPRERVVSSLGSGVIVKSDGALVTNYHVIKGAQDIRVVLQDGREFSAVLAASDEQSDLAILKMDTEGAAMPALALHDSDDLEVGDLVLAIGNPFGVGQTVTSGIVSALARAGVVGNDFSFFIQTDAAINPGNSGGALVDMQGRLVGVPTAIYSRSGGSNGIGFAIPSNMVRAMLGGEMRGGKLIKPWLGASYQPITKELAESLGLDAPRGVLVREVFDDGPADEAGMRTGDVIVRLEGQPVDNVQALRFRTAVAEIGRELPLTVLRNGREYELEVELSLPPDKPARDIRKLSGHHPLDGVTVANLNPALASELEMGLGAKGVVIVEARGRLRVGDVVLEVNKEKVTSTKQLEQLLKRQSGGWRITLLRGNQLLNLKVVR